MIRIRRFPQDDAGNGWQAGLPPRLARPALAGEVRADFVVIGAGYAGLAAARRLAELRPGAGIALLDAQELAAGASGRNSGFAIDLHHLGGAGDQPRDAALARLSRTAIAALRRQVHAHRIACDWSEIGKFHAAVSPRGRREVLDHYAAALDRMGEPYEWLDAGELHARLGTPHFHAALHTPGTVLLNPAALTRGLGDSLPPNVRLFENSPVLRADFSGPVVVETPGGRIRADKAILGVNGLTGQFGFWRGRLLGIVTYGSLTRRLTEAEHAALGGVAPWGVIPAHALAGITMRYTNDRRILIRQSARFCPSLRQSAARRAQVRADHQRLFDQRFPAIAGVPIEHSWAGHMCLSRDGSPAFGPVGPHVWTAACHNGIGITRATIGGMLAAEMALGEDNPLIGDMLSLGRPPRLPPRPLLDLGSRVHMALDLRRNRHEA